MADAFCIVCGAGMTGDEAALNYKYISRQCRDFLCPVWEKSWGCLRTSCTG